MNTWENYKSIKIAQTEDKMVVVIKVMQENREGKVMLTELITKGCGQDLSAPKCYNGSKYYKEQLIL